jgi:hypothetical protein
VSDSAFYNLKTELHAADGGFTYESAVQSDMLSAEAATVKARCRFFKNTILAKKVFRTKSRQETENK